MANTNNQPVVTDLVKTASIENVFLALRTPYMGTVIEVTDDRARVFELSVRSLAHEDGSGRSLLIGGNAQLKGTAKMKIRDLPVKRYEAHLNYKGGGRRGSIKIFD